MSLFTAYQIDYVLIQLLDISDLRNLCQVNKYYYNLITNSHLKDLYKFFKDHRPARCIDAIKTGNIEICEYMRCDNNMSRVMKYGNSKIIHWALAKQHAQFNDVHASYLIQYNNVGTIWDIMNYYCMSHIISNFSTSIGARNDCQSILEIIEIFDIQSERRNRIFIEFAQYHHADKINELAAMIDNPQILLKHVISDVKKYENDIKLFIKQYCDSNDLEKAFKYACKHENEYAINLLFHKYKFDVTPGLNVLSKTDKMRCVNNIDGKIAYDILNELCDDKIFEQLNELLDNNEQREFLILCLRDDDLYDFVTTAVNRHFNIN